MLATSIDPVLTAELELAPVVDVLEVAIYLTFSMIFTIPRL